MSDEARPHEIIIIKRHGGGHEEGHHGGAWKIAYADFVTAMMAFFLVMWLISANDKTKATIARYFNPLQLVDSTSQPPGLSDPKDKSSNAPTKGGKPLADAKDAPAFKEGAPVKDLPTAKEQPAVKDVAGKEVPNDPEAKDAKPKKDDAELFKDPYAALGEIAAKDTTAAARPGAKAPNGGTKGGAGTATAPVGRGGDAYRDPFEPMTLKPTGSIDGGAESGRAEAPLSQGEPPSVPRPGDTPEPNTPQAPGTSVQPPAAEPSGSPLPVEPQARAAEVRNRIDAILKAVAPTSSDREPRIEVRATAEGVLIALTDDAKFTMFASASAEPSPRTVTLMEKIGKLLKSQRGRIVIRGYTDSRKFKSDTYDNWRLSSARAQMAHYMLVRGGLDDARFERIEGYADRQPRNAKDPEGPENRRIEILLRDAP